MKLVEELGVEPHARLLKKMADLGQQCVCTEDGEVDALIDRLFHAFERIVKVSKDDLKSLSKTIVELVKLASPISQRVGELVDELQCEHADWLKNAIAHALNSQIKQSIFDSFCEAPLKTLVVLDSDDSDESVSEDTEDDDEITLSSSADEDGDNDRKRPRSEDSE